MPKQWVLKVKGGVKSVACPYCGYKCDYPYAYCGGCNCEVDLPDETIIIKKEWW
jgi:hypothetical protein